MFAEGREEKRIGVYLPCFGRVWISLVVLSVTTAKLLARSGRRAYSSTYPGYSQSTSTPTLVVSIGFTNIITIARLTYHQHSGSPPSPPPLWTIILYSRLFLRQLQILHYPPILRSQQGLLFPLKIESVLSQLL